MKTIILINNKFKQIHIKKCMYVRESIMTEKRTYSNNERALLWYNV